MIVVGWVESGKPDVGPALTGLSSVIVVQTYNKGKGSVIEISYKYFHTVTSTQVL